ncbi:MAG: trigger factor [Chloroflexi bacterium]|nr:trigger factor [Chloroflexota bacterium]
MKVAAQEIENSQVVLDIEVEDERLAKAVDQAYRRIVNRINVPGVRKGKAPRALVERMVGSEALVEDAVEHLVPEVVEAAVKEQDLTMVARPTLEVVSTQPLKVKATVPVQPKVELGDYHGLKIEQTPVTIDEEQVERVMTRLRETSATWEPVERPVALSDRVSLDVAAKVGETTIVDSKDAEYVVDPEGAQPAEGFAEALVGQQIDETRTYSLKLPQEYRNAELAGQEAEFTVTVHGVKERNLPDLDEAFARSVGTEYETVDQVRDAVRTNLREREDHERRVEHEESVIQAVVEQAKVDLPPQLVEEEADRLVDQTARNLDRQGIPLQQYLRLTQKSDEQFRAEMTAQAERSVRRMEVLNAVALAEGLDVTDDEIREEVARSAQSQPEAERLTREALRRPDVRERIAAALRRRNAAIYLMKTVGGVDLDADDTVAAPAEATGESLAEASDESSDESSGETAPNAAEAPSGEATAGTAPEAPGAANVGETTP